MPLSSIHPCRHDERTAILAMFWTIPDRQIETSVVLANPPLEKT